MEFIGIGDLHLTGPNGCGGFSRFVPNSDEYILSEVQRCVDYGLDNGINQVIIYGDIGDSPRLSYQAHLELRKFFKRNKEVNFHLILGNHDKLAVSSSVGHSLQLLSAFSIPNVNIYEEPKVVDFGDCKVNFLPYPANQFKRCLNVCHLELSGSVLDNGRPSKSKNGTKGRPVVSGHIHSQSTGKNLWYSGTLYQTNFGERVDRKSFHRIECIGNDVQVDTIPFKPVHELADLVYDPDMDFESLSTSKFYRLITDQEVDPQLLARFKIVSIKSIASKKEVDEFEPQFEELDLDIDNLLAKCLTKYDPQLQKNILATRARICK